MIDHEQFHEGVNRVKEQLLALLDVSSLDYTTVLSNRAEELRLEEMEKRSSRLKDATDDVRELEQEVGRVVFGMMRTKACNDLESLHDQVSSIEEGGTDGT